jgi:hypothetical protein
VNFGLWGLAVIPTYFVARKVGLAGQGGEDERSVASTSKDTDNGVKV